MIRLLLLLVTTVSCSTFSPAKERLIIYLHGMGENPLLHEKNNITVMKKSASQNGYKFLAVEAKGSCYYLNPPRPKLKCWDNRKISNQLSRILKGHNNKELVLIGFSNGAYFLGGALERNLLKDVSKVGIISGGSVWMKKFPRLIGTPKIFIENATNDKWNKKWVKEFYNRLSTKVEAENLYYREIKREHQLSPEESASFVSWILKH
ncbi:MAG: hypothetical protein NXH75_04650 [Halobacteriovoraceae bacterium]|nr:hypothetical protein [Halobacteriovoraceae bacterium]